MGSSNNMNGAVGPSTLPDCKSRKVYFEGDTALNEGEALVYAFDSTVKAGRSVPGKGNSVRVPTSTYKYYFAGVAARGYKAKTGGQWIVINLPGSVCNCLVGTASTAGTTVVVFSQTDGKFGKVTAASNEVGCGTALCLETLSAAVTGGKAILCKLLDGNDAVAPAFAAS